MKIIKISDNRRFNISSIVVGYLEENKEEVLEFEIPEKYSEYGKKACFSANGQTFAKTFDDIISNKLTITRDISQFKELDMTIAFFKIEDEDEIIARTSILHILIENAIVCDDDVKPDEPKIIVLDNLIDEVTKLDVLVTKNEEKREEYYQEIQKKVDNGDFNGATFKPSVDSEGNLSFTNDKGLDNPKTVNIRGPKGDIGEKGNSGNDGTSISSIIQTTTSTESGGTNIITATLSDGSTSTFNIMNGAKGDTGKQGLQGEPGTNGTNGIDGQSATITIGTVTTLDAGSNATVENVGTSTDAIFNFGIPKGVDGTSGTGGTGNVSSTSINSIEVVDSLPTTEVDGVLYLVKEEVNSGNLYDYESAPLLINAKVENSTIVTGTNDNRITYIKIEPKTTYKIEKTINDHFGVGLSTEEPVIGTVFNSYSNDKTLSEVTVTSGESDNYLAIYYWTKYDTGTEEEIRSSIVVTKVS